MAAVTSSWLVGSMQVAATSFSVGLDVCTPTAGEYYLRHATAAISLIDHLATVIAAATGASCTITITRARHVRIALGAAATITWGSATALRDLLGFSGDQGSSSTHTATLISPLLWSPGYPGTAKTIVGVTGYTQQHTLRYKSDDGTRTYTHRYSTETWQDLAWTHVLVSRMRHASIGGGTFHEFFEQSLALGYRCTHYEAITEDSSDDSTDVTWTTGRGPYVLRDGFDADWYRRVIPSADVACSLTLPLHSPAELS